MSKWSIKPAESKTFYLPSGKTTAKGKEILFPVTIIRLPLEYLCSDGTKEYWTIVFHRGRFSIHYPDTFAYIDKWGFHRPQGQKVVHHRDTSLDASTLARRLVDKFGVSFTKQVVQAMQAV